MLFRHQEEKEINLYPKNIRCIDTEKELLQKDRSKTMYDLAQYRTLKFAINTEDTVLKFRFNLAQRLSLSGNSMSVACGNRKRARGGQPNGLDSGEILLGCSAMRQFMQQGNKRIAAQDRARGLQRGDGTTSADDAFVGGVPPPKKRPKGAKGQGKAGCLPFTHAWGAGPRMTLLGSRMARIFPLLEIRVSVRDAVEGGSASSLCL